MFPDALARVLALPDDARVLDVGGWAAPVNRADWVIDLMPYESRGALMADGFGPRPERFNAERWVIADICGADPWPFADDYFDFAICDLHVLATDDAHCDVGSISQLPKLTERMRFPLESFAYQDAGYLLPAAL